MKQLIINIPDSSYNSFVEFFKQIPGITIEDSQSGDIPEWHKSILKERIEEYRKDPNQGQDWDDFVKELDKK